MVGADSSRSIQVLNISNVNAQGKTVLNDGKLLELIQTYPFIYNPRVRPYGDQDYSIWAWKRINAAFNHNYENDPFAAFSISDLMDRWQVLKPLIQCLSKAYDLAAIPSSLRQSVLSISTELEDPSSNCLQKPPSCTQTLLTQQMPEIAKLPLEKRLALESEVLDLILNTEMVSKQAKKLEEADIAQANEEADEFLHDIGFKQVLLTALSQQPKTFNTNTEDTSLTNSSTANGSGVIVMDDSRSKWIPLAEADNYIRPCYVHIKRMNLEDYLPLSKIRRTCKRK